MKYFLPIILIFFGLAPMGSAAQSQEVFVQNWIGPDQIWNEGEYPFIFIDFWATWCKPCIQSHPHLESLRAQFQSEVLFIGISDEPFSKVKEFYDEHGMNMNLVQDFKNKTFETYEIKSIPEAILLNPKGQVIWKGHPMEMTAEKLRKWTLSNKHTLNTKRLTFIERDYSGKTEKSERAKKSFLLESGDQVTYWKIDPIDQFQLHVSDDHIELIGSLQDIWAYFSNVSKAQILDSGTTKKNYYHLMIEMSKNKNLESSSLAESLEEHFDMQVKRHEKRTQAYTIHTNDVSSLWSNQTLHFSDVNFPLSLKGEGYLEADNFTITQLSVLLSDQFNIPITYAGTENLSFDWSLNTDSFENLKHQLLDEYSIELRQEISSMPFYTIH